MKPVKSDSAWRPQVIWPAAWVKREMAHALGFALGIEHLRFTSGTATSRFTSGTAASRFTEVQP